MDSIEELFTQEMADEAMQEEWESKIAKARAEARAETIDAITKSLYSDGMNEERISRILGLSKEQIEAILTKKDN